MPRSLHIHGIKNSDVVSVVYDSSLDQFLDTKVSQLKKKLFPHRDPAAVRLFHGGQQLEDEFDFKSYNIQNNSNIHLTSRIHGGASLPNLYANCFVYSTTESDSIAYDDDKPRVKMSCGHYVNPDSLADYCRSELQNKGKFEFACPAITNKCGKIWQYPEIRMKATLTQSDVQEFESTMSRYAASQYTEIKQCPKCQTFIERIDLTNLRVFCQICKSNGGQNDFCWQCLRDWSGPTTSGIKCGSSYCTNNSLKSLECRGPGETFQINGITIPIRRACPNCGNIVEHKKEGCKMIVCHRCNKEFCFICLELSVTCLEKKAGSWYQGCAKSTAPIQTSIPVWRRQ